MIRHAHVRLSLVYSSQGQGVLALLSIEDEPHFILHCSFYNDLRNALFSNLDNIFFNFTTMDRDEQFKFIMSANNGDADCCKLVSDFIENCYVLRNQFDLKNK